jgi:AraC-like DNA-binding protein
LEDVLAAQGREAIHLDAWERLRMRLTFQLDKNIRVDALARELGMSRRHFIRQFKKRFELGPKAFHIRSRLHHASRLLRTTDQQIKSLASDVGFGDAKSFQRVFKQYFGVSPSEFRSGSIYTKTELLTESAHAFFFDRFYLAPNMPSNWKDGYSLRGN